MIEQKLMQYLPDPNTVKENIGAAVDMLQEQAPLLVKELMRWHFCQSLILFLVGMAISIVAIIVTKIVYKAVARYDKKDEYFRFGCLSLLFFLIPSSIMMCQNVIWLKIWIAPRLFLMEYITNIFK